MTASAPVQTQTIAKPTVTPVASGMLQRAAINNAPISEVMRLPGQLLDTEMCRIAEPPFAHDFSRVQVHSIIRKQIQYKLTVGRPGDEYEQEAERIADQVRSA